MRVAIVSDIHGNLGAFNAVLADIDRNAPDLVLHGGDLADGGSSPIEIVDQIRDLGWQGVIGNGDQMLVRPESLEAFAAESSAPPALWTFVREMAESTRSILGPGRLSWVYRLPMAIIQNDFAIVHATPESCWIAPPENTSDEELTPIYGPLGRPIVIFGHTHVPLIRKLSGNPKLLINTGSVGLSYDGDPRASYLLLDGNVARIRRIEYDVEKELRALSACALPHADWTARMLRSSSPQLPWMT
jgi:predicted phosphodiesterase